MIDPKNIRSLTDFQRNSRRSLARLKRTGKPEVLTVNGQPAAVIQDPAAYAKLLELAQEAHEARLLDQAIEEANAGLGKPIRQVIEEVRRSRPAKRRARRSA